MIGRPPKRQALRWVLVMFASLSLMTLAAVANLMWLLATLGAFQPLLGWLRNRGAGGLPAVLLADGVVGTVGALLWYTGRWRAMLAAADPTDRARLRARVAQMPLSMATSAMLLAIPAHGSLYWIGNPQCQSFDLCGLYAFGVLLHANLFAAVAGALGLVLLGATAEVPMALIWLVPATLVTPSSASAILDTPVLGVPWNTAGVACLLVVLVRLARVHPPAMAPST